MKNQRRSKSKIRKVRKGGFIFGTRPTRIGGKIRNSIVSMEFSGRKGKMFGSINPFK